MSLILFVLCVNPLSHLLNKGSDGYMIGPNLHRSTKITHLLFVDGLKTYAKSKEVAESQLHLITEFSRDIGMEFGTDKCAYLYIEKGQRKYLNQNISINNLELQELKDDEPYKYLGRDEDIAYVGELNKERVLKEYYNRVRKIWNSELYSKNKTVAYTIFAIPVLIPTFGI